MNEPIPLVLGGIRILPDAGPIRQRYERLAGGSAVLRMHGGRGVKMTHFRKWRTAISGSGWLDPGLEDLDYSGGVELLCIMPRGKDGTGPNFILPPAATIRPDVAPWGLVRVGANWLETGITMAGNVAQLGPAPGASRYRLCWLPRMVVFSEGLVSDYDESTGRYDWSLDAEEV